jgi:glycosyltransferase 2 family protein
VIARLSASFWLRAALTAGVLAVLATRIDLQATGASLLRLAPAAALLVVALVALDRVTMIWRWILLLRAGGTPITSRAAVRIYLVSSFIGGFLPAGVGGDAARVYSVFRHTARGGPAVASVAIDRLLGLLSIVVLALVGVLVVGRSVGPELRTILLVGTTVTIVTGLGALWADRWVTAVVPARWQASRVGWRLSRVAEALALYRDRRETMAGVFGLSLGVQLLRILQAYLLGVGLGLDVPLSYYLFFMPIGLIALMLPISIAGFGLPQGIIVWLLQPRGVAAHDSLALSTLIVLTGILANLPGAWLYLRARRAPDARPVRDELS